jgi:hypothetical protein
LIDSLTGLETEFVLEKNMKPANTWIYKGLAKKEGFHPADLLWNLAFEEVGNFVVWFSDEKSSETECLWVDGAEAGNTFRMKKLKQLEYTGDPRGSTAITSPEARHVAVRLSCPRLALHAVLLLAIARFF